MTYSLKKHLSMEDNLDAEKAFNLDDPKKEYKAGSLQDSTKIVEEVEGDEISELNDINEDKLTVQDSTKVTAEADFDKLETGKLEHLTKIASEEAYDELEIALESIDNLVQLQSTLTEENAKASTIALESISVLNGLDKPSTKLVYSNEIFGAIGSAVKSIVDAIKKFFKMIWDAIRGLFSSDTKKEDAAVEKVEEVAEETHKLTTEVIETEDDSQPKRTPQQLVEEVLRKVIKDVYNNDNKNAAGKLDTAKHDKILKILEEENFFRSEVKDKVKLNVVRTIHSLVNECYLSYESLYSNKTIEFLATRKEGYSELYNELVQKAPTVMSKMADQLKKIDLSKSKVSYDFELVPMCDMNNKLIKDAGIHTVEIKDKDASQNAGRVEVAFFDGLRLLSGKLALNPYNGAALGKINETLKNLVEQAEKKETKVTRAEYLEEARKYVPSFPENLEDMLDMQLERDLRSLKDKIVDVIKLLFKGNEWSALDKSIEQMNKVIDSISNDASRLANKTSDTNDGNPALALNNVFNICKIYTFNVKNISSTAYKYQRAQTKLRGMASNGASKINKTALKLAKIYSKH